MNQLLFLLEKEFRQVFRNPAILRSVLVMPFIQLLVFPFAANFEVKNVLQLAEKKIVSATEVGSTIIFWKRLSNAPSFSMY